MLSSAQNDYWQTGVLSRSSPSVKLMLPYPYAVVNSYSAATRKFDRYNVKLSATLAISITSSTNPAS